MTNNESKNLMIAFLSGAIAGGALAFLASTEKGKELIKEAKEAAKEGFDQAKETYEATEKEIEEKLSKALDEETINDLEKKGREAISNLKK